MFYKFIYRVSKNEIHVWGRNTFGESMTLVTTISGGEKMLSNDDILELCHKWLNDKKLSEAEYKVFIELY